MQNIDAENGFRPILCICICVITDAMLICNVDVNADVMCEQSITVFSPLTPAPFALPLI